jgi:hypothetical protein
MGDANFGAVLKRLRELEAESHLRSRSSLIADPETKMSTLWNSNDQTVDLLNADTEQKNDIHDTMNDVRRIHELTSLLDLASRALSSAQADIVERDHLKIELAEANAALECLSDALADAQNALICSYDRTLDVQRKLMDAQMRNADHYASGRAIKDISTILDRLSSG